ncbi:uncharacterized protein BDW43DRAFT_280325 [Aspergillus alliaceus]|uniref:uncharacterized protein n=1 Tax=Petromyces alliaceus TaxID=209559 RepID=UPI0012A6107C|nr:uncharacterized protein BDW43DRAFT_280325 [Aspergillus alliaceus]KAB8232079.1 hypothetical protein BDW43DRAFT_280325 [Aspergillus alliaceus]
MYVLFPMVLIIGVCVFDLTFGHSFAPSLLFREKQKTSSSYLSPCMVVCAAHSHIPI